MKHPAVVALVSMLALMGCSDDDVPVPCAPGACGAGFVGPSGEVRILRDSLGVVHVYGRSDADVMYGSGYAQAADRLFQMDVTRRRALGRRAEIFGAGSLEEDTLLRIVDLPRRGRDNAELVRATRPDVYALIEAWTAGVNARIDEVLRGDTPLPYGFGPDELDYLPERWNQEDAYTVGKMILFGNANVIEFEVLATILRDYFPEALAMPALAPLVGAYIMPPEERPMAGNQPLSGTWPPTAGRPLPPDAAEHLARFVAEMSAVRPGGSNNWAIDGTHTASGRPLIAGDPHQGLQSPSLMWAHHMNSADAGGTIDVAGFSFVGGPGVQLGHNAALAWTATTNYPDTMDLWDVAIGDGVALLGGMRVPTTTRAERIEVKGEAAVDVSVVEVPGYGVVLPDGLAPLPIVSAGNSLLLGWTGLAPTNDAIGFFGIATASNLEEFEAGVDRMEIGNFNFVAATASGISYRSSPLVPDRGPPTAEIQPYTVLDGSDPETLWSGQYLPLDVMPHSRGGERGWLASANNDPFGFTADNTVVGDPFYFGVFFDPGTRARRVEDEITRLVAAGAVTLEDVQALQVDTHSIPAALLAPVLAEVFATVDTDDALAPYRERADLAELAALIAGWDGRMGRESRAALVYHAFMWFAVRGAVADELGPAFDPIAGASPIYALKLGLMVLTGAFTGSEALLQEGRSQVVMAALDATATFLAERFGSPTARGSSWGDFHGTRFRSLWGDRLDGGWVPTDGADGTVNVSAASFLDGDGVVSRMESGGGAIYRMSAGFDADGVPAATINYPRGNSGDPDSPHFADTVDAWVEGEYRPLLFRTADVLADSVEERVLGP